MFSERFKIVRVQTVVAANAFTMSDYLSMKNVKHATFVISHAGATDTDLTVGLDEATAVAAGTHRSVTAVFPILVDIDHGTTSDTLVREAADAATYKIDPATMGSAIVVFEWDPAKHTEGYDCIAVRGSGGDASDTVVVFAILEMKYQQASLPSCIID